ncbi:MAG TPA: zf-HC2 domain-containing protein [Candidatus Kapabacteria bacterium]|nr:zf-HC2 domain-containing protein [Candidatus Kapabacteria bacterium]
MKNHPTQEQWMDYLYGEMPSPEKKTLEAHLMNCAPCREKQQEFAGTMENLDAWRVVIPQKVSLKAGLGRFQPVVKWAAAAALLVSTGFAAARFSQPQFDVATLQAQIAQQVTTQVQKPLEFKMREEFDAAAEQAVADVRKQIDMEVAARLREISLRAESEAILAVREQMDQLATQLASLHDEDRKKMNQSLKAFETQWLTEYRKMREDLERVALFSDQSYRAAQRQLVQLASFSQPQGVDTSESDN